MRKKKKHGQSSKLRLIAVISVLVILLLIGIVAPLFVGINSYSAYATEPWHDPFRLCSTNWYLIGQDVNNPELVEAVSETNLPVRDITVQSAAATACRNASGGETSYAARQITFLIDDTQDWYTDYEQIGLIAGRIVDAVKDTDISQQWGDDDMLVISFVSNSSWRRAWRMNYAEAVRAHEAGLTGLDLYNLGQR